MSGLFGFIELRFYYFDGTRREVVLPEAKGIKITDALGADGAAEYRAALMAQALEIDPDLLEGPGFCRAAICLVEGQPLVEVMAWELMPTSGTVIGEVDEKEVQCAAPGTRHVHEAAIVHSEGGAWDKTDEDERCFGWMSKANGYWFDSSDWSTPLDHGFRKLLKNGQGAQKICADLTAAAGDVHLLRTEVTIATSAPVKIYWQADDEATLYVDSEVAGTTSEANTTQGFVLGWSGPRTHTISAEVTNTLGGEMGLVLMVVNLSTNRVIRKSDTTSWVAHKVIGGVKPGMTIGAILRTLHNEANQPDQDVWALEHFIPDFDGDTDSNGDPWPDVQEFRVPVGSTNGDVIRQLEELGCHVHHTPDGTYQAFIEQGEDVSDTVRFEPDLNLLRLDYNGQPVKGTKAVGRTRGGWLTRTSAMVATWGKRYFSVTAGTSVTTAQGARLLDRALEEADSPRYTYTAILTAVEGCVPWLDFYKGDLVSCPNRVGEMTVMRVLSISASTPDDTPSPVTAIVELDVP